VIPLRHALCGLLLVSGVLPSSGADASAAEAFIARAYIPSSNNIHGEVRLIARDGGTCVQTLLYSKYLRRGLHEMELEERRRWPAGKSGYEDSTNYIACMRQARDLVLAATEAKPVDPRKKLLIEFTLGPDSAGYALYGMDIAGPPDALRIENRRLLCQRKADAYYVSRAMSFMGTKGFGLTGDKLDELMRKAGWHSVGARVQPDGAVQP
jgi:hypothetical protein